MTANDRTRIRHERHQHAVQRILRSGWCLNCLDRPVAKGWGARYCSEQCRKNAWMMTRYRVGDL